MTTTQIDDGVVVATFRTLGGAHVVVTKHSGERYNHRWHCEGCQDRGASVEVRRAARDAANEHAGRCRSVRVVRTLPEVTPEVTPEIRADVLRYASTVATRRWLPGEVTECAGPLLAWLEKADTAADLDARTEALHRWHANVTASGRDDRTMSAGEALEAATVFYAVLVGGGASGA